MQWPVNFPAKRYKRSPPPVEEEEVQEITDIEASVMAVENLLNYRFRNRKLLEEALTHSSYPDSASYQRLEFVGDAALGLAITNYVYLRYPDVDPGKLSLVRAANISTEKLARVAVRHQLYKYVRHNVDALEVKVGEFVEAVEQEYEAEIYGGFTKAPKVLADIVEAVAAAVYVDCNFDLKKMWMVLRDFLEPIVLLDDLEGQPQPVTKLFEVCQKDGKKVDIKYWREGEKNIASVFVDGQFIASASSEQKENAKLRAAKAALRKLSYGSEDVMDVHTFGQLNGDNEFEGAKQKLHELCGKKKWPKPDYKIHREAGRAHEKIYISSVKIEGILSAVGKEKSRLKEADNSAASIMLRALQEYKYI